MGIVWVVLTDAACKYVGSGINGNVLSIINQLILVSVSQSRRDAMLDPFVSIDRSIE